MPFLFGGVKGGEGMEWTNEDLEDDRNQEEETGDHDGVAACGSCSLDVDAGSVCGCGGTL